MWGLVTLFCVCMAACFMAIATWCDLDERKERKCHLFSIEFLLIGIFSCLMEITWRVIG